MLGGATVLTGDLVQRSSHALAERQCHGGGQRAAPERASGMPPGDELLDDGASYLPSGIGADARRRLLLGREPGLMTDDEYQPVAVSRRICAPAHDIFQILANPARHPEFDGSESLRMSLANVMGPGCCHEEGTAWRHE